MVNIKCKIVTYRRKHQQIVCDYSLSNVKIQRNCTITDLGIVFDEKFRFIIQTEKVVSQASSAYGYIVRSCMLLQIQSGIC